MAARKKIWGGRRAGAGRKPVLKNPGRVTVNLEKEDLESLQDEAQDHDLSVGELIRKLVTSHIKRRRK
jgi:predicted DNA-binding ribbon-helix-helix protein